MRLYKFAPLAVLLSTQAFAVAPTITGGTNASAITLTGTPVFFGGFVGASVAGDGITTLNTCATVTGPVACNTTAIYNELVLRVAAKNPEAGKNLIITKSDRTAITNVSPSTESAGVTWANLCLAMTGSTGNCDTFTAGGQGQFKIFADKNNNGVLDADETEGTEFTVRLIKVPTTTYDTAPPATSEGLTSFSPYPGDEKVYIEDVVAVGNSMSLQYGSKAVKLRVMMSPNNMTEAVPNGGLEPKDLSITDGGANLDDSVVDGLTNGQTYFFRIGMVDEANNLVLMLPATGAEADCDSGQSTCKYSATPDEVVGLLTEDLNCFVATAAYGSALEPKLKTFREFRFKQLLPHKWGRSFVKWYYHYGPYLARYIHDKPVMRAGARVLLWPAYGFSRVAIAYGIYPAFIFALTILSLLFTLPFIKVRK